MFYNNDPALLALLRSHHRIKVELFILDRDRRVLMDVSDTLIDGVLDIDAEGDVSRKGKVSLLDPQQRLTIDFTGAGYGGNLGKRMLQIIYTVYSMDWSQQYRVPIFAGPITDSKRDGVVVDLEFSGMEWYLLNGMLRDTTYPVGWNRSEITMEAVRGSAGINAWEVRNEKVNSPPMGSAWSVEGGENLWAKLKELNDSQACNIFFDGNGILNIRPKNTTPVIVFGTEWLTEEPDYIIDLDNVRNVVRVEGANVPGTNVPLWYEAWPPPEHPLSAQALAKAGIWLVLPRVIKDTSLTNWGDVFELALQTLAWDLMKAESMTAVIPVVPMLEEFDVIHINHPKVSAISTLVKASIPLVGDAEMSLNMFTTSSTGRTSRSGGRGNYAFAEDVRKHGGGKKGGKKGPNVWGPGGPQTGNTFKLHPEKGNKNKGKKNRNRKGGK